MVRHRTGRTTYATSAPSPWCFAEWGDSGVADDARAVAGDIEGSLALARGREHVARSMGRDTWRVLSSLATLGSADLTTARTVEPHWDAVAILEQASTPAPEGATWGVYAASPPGTRLVARRDEGGLWRLTGAKTWCSLADRVSHALVTADRDDGPASLFAVDLGDTGVSVDPGAFGGAAALAAALWAPPPPGRPTRSR
jgi:alkylation response protein AidB-like acyl-CoA dehydrogenase